MVYNSTIIDQLRKLTYWGSCQP